MLEIEMKFPLNDFTAVQQHLQSWHATAQPAIDEADHYFNAPDRDFAQTDEAFRLRCIGTQNRVTYKGPKQGGPTKTRTELEIGLEPGAEAAEEFRRMVQHLGYRLTQAEEKQYGDHIRPISFGDGLLPSANRHYRLCSAYSSACTDRTNLRAPASAWP